MRLKNTLGLAVAVVLGNTDYRYKGRGFVQLTGQERYSSVSHYLDKRYKEQFNPDGPFIQIKEFSFVYKSSAKFFKNFEFTSWCTGVAVAGCIVHRLPIQAVGAFDREFIVEHVNVGPTNYYVLRKMVQTRSDVDSFMWSFSDTHITPEVLGFLLNYEPIENNPFRQQVMTALHRFDVIMNLTTL